MLYYSTTLAADNRSCTGDAPASICMIELCQATMLTACRARLTIDPPQKTNSAASCSYLAVFGSSATAEKSRTVALATNRRRRALWCQACFGCSWARSTYSNYNSTAAHSRRGCPTAESFLCGRRRAVWDCRLCNETMVASSCQFFQG